ncbi:DUF418 domain-containing protein [Allonocardiopsis opalescens]|uniref:Putative membrane protein YeiB n=1 Tax=Allonocardiopsis opalescens TaxID=1144618 RepID=A0A2T0QF45_9ACTN|nr:DUF418 domain-containing protein [Allonocardiopsis opalescens]PRY02549.1 putative membrane protein YeiB [Allonocardiopsis opalescens]
MPPAPPGAAARHLAPDLARGTLLLLIAIAYAPAYLEVASASVGAHPAGGGALDTAARTLAVLVVDNRAFPMFAALFGYGLVVLIDKRRAAGACDVQARRLVRRRSLVLLAFGFAHAVLVFPGEILGAYGVAGLMVAGLLAGPRRGLLSTAVAAGAVSTVLVTGAAWAGWYSGREPIAGYTRAADWVERIALWPVTPLVVLATYPLLPALLLGAWAGRRRLLHEPRRHRRLLAWAAATGITVSLAGAAPSALIASGALADPAWAEAALGVQTLTGMAGGLGYAALFGLIAAAVEQRRTPVVRALAAAGRRSLTVYLLSSGLLALVLHRDLLGAGSHLNSAGATAVAAGCWLVAVLAALALEGAGRPGPADALLRHWSEHGRARGGSG